MLNDGGAAGSGALGRAQTQRRAGPENPTPPPHIMIKPPVRPRKTKRGFHFALVQLPSTTQRILVVEKTNGKDLPSGRVRG